MPKNTCRVKPTFDTVDWPRNSAEIRIFVNTKVYSDYEFEVESKVTFLVMLIWIICYIAKFENMSHTCIMSCKHFYHKTSKVIFAILLSSYFYSGPGCDSLCNPAGLLAGKWNKPMISYSCSSRVLSDRENYPTFARTTALYVEMANFIIDIIKYHFWDRVVLVEGPESIWRETVGEFQVWL